MTTTTATAKKPTPDKNDEVKSVKKREVCDVTNIVENEERDLSTEDRKRLAGFGRMSNRLFERYEEILLPLLKRYRGSEAEYRYRVGVVVVDIRDNLHAYGRSDVRQLADALECSPSNLYDYARVARAWEHQAFSELMNRKGKQGYRLRFSHLIEIASVSDLKDRQRWIDLALEHGWPVKKLVSEIKKVADEVPAVLDESDESDVDGDEDGLGMGMDEVATPVTIRQAIVRMCGELKMLPGMLPEWRERVSEPLRGNTKLIGGQTLDELERTLDECNSTIKSTQELKQEIEEFLRIGGRVQSGAESDATEEGGELNV